MQASCGTERPKGVVQEEVQAASANSQMEVGVAMKKKLHLYPICMCLIALESEQQIIQQVIDVYPVPAPLPGISCTAGLTMQR